MPGLRALRPRRGRADRQSACAQPGPSRSARRTPRSSAPARRRSTRCSAPRATPTTRRRRAAAAAAARRWPSPPGCSRSPDGSDLGGSLRNPAGYCNVVGFRPSPGRVPIWPSQVPWFPMGVQGPMARNVTDVALMLSAIAGPDPRAPISLPDPGTDFRPPLQGNVDGDGRRLEQGSRGTARRPAGDGRRRRGARDVRAPRLRGRGRRAGHARGRRGVPGLARLVLRGLLRDAARRASEAAEGHRRLEHRRRTAARRPRLGEAARTWSALLDRVRRFFERCEFLVLPVTQVPRSTSIGPTSPRSTA